MGLKFYKKSVYDLSNPDPVTTVTDAIATSTGEDFTDFLRNRDLRSGWMTTGSTDAANTTLEIDFNDVREFDRIMILGHNLKAFTLKYWNGSTWTNFSTAIAETANTATSNYYEFTKVLSDKLQLIITGTQTPDVDKSIKQIIVTEFLGAFDCEPKVEPIFDKDRKANKYLSGKTFISKAVGAFTARVRMGNAVSENDLALVETLFSVFEGFLMSPSGGTTTQFETIREGWRLEDIYYMACSNEYNPEWADGYYKNGMPIDMKLVEVN